MNKFKVSLAGSEDHHVFKVLHQNNQTLVVFLNCIEIKSKIEKFQPAPPQHKYSRKIKIEKVETDGGHTDLHNVFWDIYYVVEINISIIKIY